MLFDLKIALRSLLKTPGLVAVVVATLALGIGANTAVFSVIKTVLIEPVPYPQPEQLVLLWERAPNFEFASIPLPNLRDWRRQARSFSSIGGFGFADGRLRYERAGEVEMIDAMQAHAELFETLKVTPQIGRLFTRDEDKPGAPGLALLSHAFWERSFDADPAVVGRTLSLNGEAYTVIGVMPPQFQPESQIGLSLQSAPVAVWTQLGRFEDRPGFDNRANHIGIIAVGRLRPGATVEQGITELKAISARIRQQYPEIGPFEASGAPMVSKAVEGFENLWLLQGAVGLVLLIACANIASLLAARGVTREAEFGVRIALGSSQGQLMRQLLIESLLLSTAGAVLGVLVAYWVHGAIEALNAPRPLLLAKSQMGYETFGVTAALAVGTALLFGLWPAYRAARINLRAALQAGGRTGSAGGVTLRARSTLTVAQVALTMVLLTSSGLLLKSLVQAQAVDLGFKSHGVLTAKIELPRDSYGTVGDASGRIRDFTHRLLDRLRTLPSVEAADSAAFLPLERGWQRSYGIEGQPNLPRESLPPAEVNFVSDGYFNNLRIPLLRGRAFGPEDDSAGERAVIIDDASARRHWPQEDALGKRIRIGNIPYSVVGIVPTQRMYGYATEPSLLQSYLSIRQEALPSFSLLVRSRLDPAAVAAPVRAAVREIDPRLPLSEVRTLDERVAETFNNPRVYTFLFGVFAALALLLASIGLYGLLAFQVTSQTRDFGIRIALGARHRQIMMQVLANGLRLVALGVLLGLLIALLLGRAMSALLFQTEAFDPTVLTGVAVILGAVALVACWLPARRAIKVDPLVALRAE